jgi:hypothetical protein
MKNPAWQFEHSAVADVPRWFAWEFWSDLSNWERVQGEGVESIRLEVPFVAGTIGVIKMAEQDLQPWVISRFEAGRSATIETALQGAIFSIETHFEALDPGRTLISQRMTLDGDRADQHAQAMRVMETSAPQDLAKLVTAMESARSLG